MLQPSNVAGKQVAKLVLETCVAASLGGAATLKITVLPPRTARATAGAAEEEVAVAAGIAVKGVHQMCVQPIITITRSKWMGLECSPCLLFYLGRWQALFMA